MPLVRSFALSTKNGRETWIQPIVDRGNKRVRFEIRTGPGCPDGTVGRNGAMCFATGSPVPLNYIREEGKAGRMSSQLMAIVTEGPKGRIYLPPTTELEMVPRTASPEVTLDVELPTNPRWFSPPGFGLTKFSDLFTRRQLVALGTICELIAEATELAERHAHQAGAESAKAYAEAIATYLAFGLDKSTLTNCTLATWQSKPDRLTQALGRQALPMTWDYAEANPLSSAGGGYVLTGQSISDVLTSSRQRKSWHRIAAGCG